MKTRKTRSIPGLALSLALAWTTATHAANLEVTTTMDSGTGSLRVAIAEANLTPEADTITFAVSGIIALFSTLPEITSHVVIDGSGQEVTISGEDAVRVMQVASDGVLELRHLTVSNGRAPSVGDRNGAGIENKGTVTVRNCVFSGNTAPAGFGGAIFNDHRTNLTIIDSTLSENRGQSGGAIDSAGQLTVSGSTFSHNMAVSGGALVSRALASISNSTFSGNSASFDSGAIANVSGLTLTNSTVFDNHAPAPRVGGILTYEGLLIMANSIVAGNTGGDCIHAISEIRVTGPNLVGDGTCAATLSGDPRLGPLQDNGGSTHTHALLEGSPAIDAGSDAICSSAPVNNQDQRGQPRPAGAACDLGAYEYAEFYPFTGFYPPIGSLPIVNTVKAGQAVPVKFSLGGDRGLNVFAAGYPVSQQEPCGDSSLTSEVQPAATPGGSTLSYDPATDTYTFVWKTERHWANTCRQLLVKLTDGTTHLASFRFR